MKSESLELRISGTQASDLCKTPQVILMSGQGQELLLWKVIEYIAHGELVVPVLSISLKITDPGGSEKLSRYFFFFLSYPDS